MGPGLAFKLSVGCTDPIQIESRSLYPKKRRIMKIILSVLLLSVISWSEERDPGARIPQYVAEGQLISLRIVPGDRTAKIFLIGQKRAEVDLRSDAKILSVFLEEKPNEVLMISDKGRYYEVQGVPSAGKPYQLSIRAKVGKQTEDLHVRVNPTKP